METPPGCLKLLNPAIIGIIDWPSQYLIGPEKNCVSPQEVALPLPVCYARLLYYILFKHASFFCFVFISKIGQEGQDCVEAAELCF